MVEKKKEKKVKTENEQKKVKTEKTVKEEKTGKVKKKIPEEKKRVLKGKPGKKAEVKKTKIPAPRKEVKKESIPKKEEEKKVYRVTGSFLMGSRYQTFTKEVMTSDPKEKIYSDFGSSHKVKRRNIKIDDVKELKNDEITDSLLKQLAKGE